MSRWPTVQHHHLVIKACRAQWAPFVVTVLIAVTFGRIPPTVPGTSSLSSATRASATHSFAGATFSPTVTPTIVKVKVSGNMNLSWSQVTVSSGAAITYVVKRTSGTGTVTTICTAVGAITISLGVVRCTDGSPGANPTYTQQPTIVRNSQTTWTRPASNPA